MTKSQDRRIAKRLLRWGAFMDYFQSPVAILPSQTKGIIANEIKRRDGAQKYAIHFRINENYRLYGRTK